MLINMVLLLGAFPIDKKEVDNLKGVLHLQLIDCTTFKRCYVKILIYLLVLKKFLIYFNSVIFQLPANYEFTYDVQDNGVSLDFGHNEKRKDDRAQGSYHVLLPDGRTQLVEYEAGPDGYRPQVTRRQITSC